MLILMQLIFYLTAVKNSVTRKVQTLYIVTISTPIYMCVCFCVCVFYVGSSDSLDFSMHINIENYTNLSTSVFTPFHI